MLKTLVNARGSRGVCLPENIHPTYIEPTSNYFFVGGLMKGGCMFLGEHTSLKPLGNARDSVGWV